MKRNLLFLTLVLALLTGLYFLVKRPAGSSLSPSAKFSVEDTSAITEIEISLYVREEKKETVSLRKGVDGTWFVNGNFEAQQQKVHRLLKVIHRLEVKEELTEAGQKGALEKMKKNHTRVNISGNSGLIKSYMIGPTNPKQTGNVMLLTGEDVPYVMTKPGAQEGYIYLFYSPQFMDWRDLGVFSADSTTLQLVRVIYPGSDSSFTLSRQNAGSAWLLDGKPVSTQAANNYVRGFNGKVSAESFADTRYPGLMDSLRRNSPDVIFEVRNFSGNPVILHLFKKNNNSGNYYGWIKATAEFQKEELMTFQGFVLDRFLVRKLFFQQS